MNPIFSIIHQKNNIKVLGGQVFSQYIYTQQNKHKPVIIFIHGGPGGQSSKFLWSFSSLANHIPMIFYDQLGGGFSKQIQQNFDRKSLWTIKRFVNQLQTVIKFYGLNKFLLFGTSWGSTLALQYYLSKQASMKPIAMILNSPLISTKMWVEDSNILKKQMPQQVYKDMINCQEQGKTSSPLYQEAINLFNQKHVIRKQMLTAQKSKQIQQAYGRFNDQAYMNMWGPSQFYCSGSLKTLQRFQDLKQINIPVLYTSGQFDEVRSETIHKFHEQTKQSQIRIFQKCSHCNYFEDQESYRPVLKQFYDKIIKR